MNDTLDLAKYIILKYNQLNIPITNLRLQKILYFIKAHFIENNLNAFDDTIRAWQHGPVIPRVYIEYKRFADNNITLDLEDLPRINNKELVDSVINETLNFTTNRLVDITHNQTTWVEAYVDNFDNEITDEMMHDYFGK